MGLKRYAKIVLKNKMVGDNAVTQVKGSCWLLTIQNFLTLPSENSLLRGSFRISYRTYYFPEIDE